MTPNVERDTILHDHPRSAASQLEASSPKTSQGEDVVRSSRPVREPFRVKYVHVNCEGELQRGGPMTIAT
ncbi:NAD dependent epimerase/dehydratase family protein [Anopheles sinensis]|uniref:NAD dependent epimerase/dehydratase family protein n=1 Tax=Anopheles sinensis TaxID=74873 RepID=A0A084WI34_ANOSI|nr:NAD dependent epimerase/dehydratase family protein [Anopheles sinensis]